MENLSSAVSSPQQSSPSKSSIISEVLKLYDACKSNDEPKILNEIRRINVAESDEVELENNDVFPIEQHMDHNKKSNVSSGASSVVCDNNVMNEQRIPNEVQQTNVVRLDTTNMGNSNVVPYEQYVKHNVESIVPSDASSVDNDVCELDDYTVVIPDDTLTTRLNILKD
jgi:hypothetical protein